MRLTALTPPLQQRYSQSAGYPLVDELVPADRLGPPPVVAKMIADGLVRRVRGDLLCPVNVPDSPALRARALLLSGKVPEKCVVGRLTAAWVHCGGTPPPVLELQVGPGGRSPLPELGRSAHETTFGAQDVTRIAGLLVTSLPRTALDVARWYDTEQAAGPLLQLQRAGVDLARVAQNAPPGLRYLQRARKLLTALAQLSASASG